MHSALTALLLAGALAGCAAPQKPLTWYKDGVTERDFQQAQAQCEYEVSVATQGTDYSFRTVIGQEMDRAMRQRDLGTKCMQAKGYRLTP